MKSFFLFYWPACRLLGLNLIRSVAVTNNPAQLLRLVAAFIVATGNETFFQLLSEPYPLNSDNLLFLASMVVFQMALLVFVLTPLMTSRFTKPVLIITLMASSGIGYFQDELHVMFGSEVIRSMIETDSREATGLLNPELILQLVFFGAIPAWFVWKQPLMKPNIRQWLFQTLRLAGGSFVVLILCFLSSSAAYTSFFREHKSIRYFSNPISAFYGTSIYLSEVFQTNEDVPFRTILPDAVRLPSSTPRVVIMVVGEAARPDHMAINGYTRNTTPLLNSLSEEISNQVLESCGTATAISVPCIFSQLDRSDFDVENAKHQENVLDVLARTGVEILWRDNNSDSKSVAVRVPYEDFKSEALNPACDSECRDIGMLEGLEETISKAHDDTLIVLHQMGSHGPAYAERYPKAFEEFSPVCRSSDLSSCTNEEINNAYDNTILYTDYFLSEIVELLRQIPDKQTAMIYVGDHGESLGEHGFYLHGMPYAFAPDQQTHVPFITWKNAMWSEPFLKDITSQDDLFPGLLALFSVKEKAG